MFLTVILQFATLALIVVFILVGIKLIALAGDVKSFISRADSSVKSISEDVKVLSGRLDTSFKSIAEDFSAVRVKSVQALNEVSEIKNTVTAFIDETRDLKDKLIDSLENVDGLAKNVEKSVSNLDNKVDALFGILKPVETILGLIGTKFATPMNISSNLVNAAGKAVSAFKSKLFGR